MMIGFRGFRFWIILAGGCRECHSSAANEDGYDILWYRSGTLDRRTCYQFSRQWQPAKPSTGMSFGFPFLHNGQCCIRTFLRTSIATGFNPLYGFRNLIYCWLRQMEQLLFARTKKEFFYIGFLAKPSNFSCQTLGDCLCTPDALHNSNSIRYFWASVCVSTNTTNVNIQYIHTYINIYKYK